MSTVKHFVQGQEDATLFGLVGPWLSSKVVLAELGAPVSSDVGDVWHVCVDGYDAIGFALTHPVAGGAHIKNIYAERNPAKTREQLLKEVLAMLKAVDRVFTFARASDDLWSKHGFTFKPRARGEFGTWEKSK